MYISEILPFSYMKVIGNSWSDITVEPTHCQHPFGQEQPSPWVDCTSETSQERFSISYHLQVSVKQPGGGLDDLANPLPALTFYNVTRKRLGKMRNNSARTLFLIMFLNNCSIFITIRHYTFITALYMHGVAIWMSYCLLSEGHGLSCLSICLWNAVQHLAPSRNSGKGYWTSE